MERKMLRLHQKSTSNHDMGLEMCALTNGDHSTDLKICEHTHLEAHVIVRRDEL